MSDFTTKVPLVELDQLELKQEKYLAILKEKGVDEAVSALHRDLWALEDATFEGSEGFQEKLWEILTEYRKFSSELWDYAKGIRSYDYRKS